MIKKLADWYSRNPINRLAVLIFGSVIFALILSPIFYDGLKNKRQVVLHPNRVDGIYADVYITMETPGLEEETEFKVTIDDIVFTSTGGRKFVTEPSIILRVIDNGHDTVNEIINIWEVLDIRSVFDVSYSEPVRLTSLYSSEHFYGPDIQSALSETKTVRESWYDYPFIEGNRYRIYFQASMQDEEGARVSVLPVFHIRIVNRANWFNHITDKQITFESSQISIQGSIREPLSEFYEISVDSHIPFYLRLLVIFLSVGIILLIGFLAEIKSTEGFVEGASALLFGIFGARQLVVPASLEGSSILDIYFLLCYGMISIVAIYKSIPFLARGIQRYTNVFNKKQVFGSQTRVFHQGSCSFISSDSLESFRLFESENDAIDAGYRKCKKCFRDG